MGEQPASVFELSDGELEASLIPMFRQARADPNNAGTDNGGYRFVRVCS